MCGVLEILGRVVIAILSIITSILGVVLLAFGIIVKTQATMIQGLLDSAIKKAASQATTATGTTLSTDNFDINSLVGGLATAFIIAGVVMLVLGVFGIAGACCKVKCMLIIYMVIVGVILISQIALVIILSTNRGMVTDPPKAQLKSTMQAEYQGANGTDTQSLLWNVVMQSLQCCGIDGVADFTSAPKWVALWGSGTTANFQSPAACCKSASFTSTSAACVLAPTTTNSNINTGCYELVWDLIFTGTNFIIFAAADIGLFALLTIFSGVILYKIVQDKKNGMV